MAHPQEQNIFYVKYYGNKENAANVIYMPWKVAFLEVLCKPNLTSSP